MTLLWVMKFWTEEQLALLETLLEKKIRVPGATYSLFRLIFQIVFLEIINCSDMKKCHKIYFEVLSSLFFQQPWLSVPINLERLCENQCKKHYFSVTGDWSDRPKQLVHLCGCSFSAVLHLTENFVLRFWVWLQSVLLGMHSVEQCS